MAFLDGLWAAEGRKPSAPLARVMSNVSVGAEQALETASAQPSGVKYHSSMWLKDASLWMAYWDALAQMSSGTADPSVKSEIFAFFLSASIFS